MSNNIVTIIGVRIFDSDKHFLEKMNTQWQDGRVEWKMLPTEKLLPGFAELDKMEKGKDDFFSYTASPDEYCFRDYFAVILKTDIGFDMSYSKINFTDLETKKQKLKTYLRKTGMWKEKTVKLDKNGNAILGEYEDDKYMKYDDEDRRVENFPSFFDYKFEREFGLYSMYE